jgi:hypothetical protein
VGGTAITTPTMPTIASIERCMAEELGIEDWKLTIEDWGLENRG